MIEKWYCLRCDKCGEVVNYWQRSSIKGALKAEKELDESLIKGKKIYCTDCAAILNGEKSDKVDYYFMI